MPDASKLREGAEVTLGWPYDDGRLVAADEVSTAGP